MTATTSTSSRNASKRAPRATPRTVPPTVADVVTPVGLDLDADIADVVATHGTLDTIESGHAAALVALTERTDYALSEYVRLARVWKSQRRAIGGFHVAIGSGDKNTHRRLMLAGELWDAYQTVPDVTVSLLRCLRWVHVSDAKDIARDILSIRDSVSDTVGLSLDLPVRQVKATRAARPDDGTSSTGEGTGEGTGRGFGRRDPLTGEHVRPGRSGDHRARHGRDWQGRRLGRIRGSGPSARECGSGRHGGTRRHGRHGRGRRGHGVLI
jgi:hypothetical protein